MVTAHLKILVCTLQQFPRTMKRMVMKMLVTVKILMDEEEAENEDGKRMTGEKKSRGRRQWQALGSWDKTESPEREINVQILQLYNPAYDRTWTC
jgi:hypothetical protein